MKISLPAYQNKIIHLLFWFNLKYDDICFTTHPPLFTWPTKEYMIITIYNMYNDYVEQTTTIFIT